MTEVSSSRLNELAESLKATAGRPVHEVIGDFEEAIRLATRTCRHDLVTCLITAYLEYFEDPVPYEVRFHCRFCTGTLLWRTGNLDEAVSEIKTSRDIAREAGDSYSASRCDMALGVIGWAKGDYTGALALLEEAEKSLRERRDLTLSNCLNWLGVTCDNLKLFQRAWAYYREALQLNEEMSFDANQAFLFCNMGLLCQRMGLNAQAEKSFRESMELQEQVGNKYGYTDSLANLGMLILKKNKQPAEALPILRKAAEMLLENNERGKAGLVFSNAALAAFETGDAEGAAVLFDKAEELLFSTEMWSMQVEFCGMKAHTLIALDDYEKAELLFRRGMDIQSRNLPGWEDLNFLKAQSELYAKTGEHEKAYGILLKSVSAEEKIEQVRSTALQSVIQDIQDSARKSRELQEVKHQTSLLEERNKALSESEERFRKLVHSMSGIGVLAVDMEGRITFWNRICELIYGYSFSEVQDLRLTDVIVPRHLRQWYDSFLEGKLSGKEYEISLLAADGTHKLVQTSLVSLCSDETFVIQIDITNQRKAENEKSLIEAQMQRSQKLEALGTLAGGIAHDFNNLLQGILGNASLLCDSFKEESEYLEPLKIIKTAAERSSELCAQMLDYTGIKPVCNEIISINDVLRDVSALLRSSFPKNAELVLELSPEMPMVTGDSSKFSQVIMNLAINGAEAIRNSGKVVISTGRVFMDRTDFKGNILEESPPAGDYLLLKVRDEGEGIDNQSMGRLFDPFYSTKKTGRGLGLAAVLGIVRGYGGAITVHSEPGIGSEFSIYLRLSGDSHPPSLRDQPPEELPDIAGRRVIVVDDEHIVRETVAAILRSCGCIPVVFDGGVEVLEFFEDSDASGDIMILDLTMPGMNGIDVLRIMAERGFTIPVLIVSGYSREKLSPLFVNCRPEGFLQKPFTPAELRRKLASIFAGD